MGWAGLGWAGYVVARHETGLPGEPTERLFGPTSSRNSATRGEQFAILRMAKPPGLGQSGRLYGESATIAERSCKAGVPPDSYPQKPRQENPR